MANRILKDSICSSGTIAALKTAEAEVLFYRLIATVDDYGCFDGRPEIIRARCFPLVLDRATVGKVTEWLSDLQEVGLLRRYAVDGKTYIALTKWFNHQRMRSSKRRYPSPPENNLSGDLPPVAADSGNPPPESEAGVGSRSRRRNPETEPEQPSADGLELAKQLRNSVVENSPSQRIAKANGVELENHLRRWGFEMDKIIRAEKWTPQRISNMIRWVRAHNKPGPDGFCWASVVLSPNKLRGKGLLAKIDQEGLNPRQQTYVDPLPESQT